MNLDVDNSQLEERKKEWVKPAPKIKKGYLAKYSMYVSSAAEGAIFKKS
ncbi:dihydroxy-acid dehydratase [Flexistipes sinusarabici]|nr:dihydroxy-acid dehydratase [Flexistipes sinusarabici]